MKEMEAKVVKQITHVTAKVLACENTVSSHEQRLAAMDESISNNNCVCTGRVPNPTSLFLPTSFCM
jgi:hypothetical protein